MTTSGKNDQATPQRIVCPWQNSVVVIVFIWGRKKLTVDRLETKKVFEIRKRLSFVYKQIYNHMQDF